MKDAEFAKLIDIQQKLATQDIHHWSHYVFLTYRWWILVGILTIPWIIWILVSDRKKDGNLLPNALFIMIVSSLLDTIGSTLTLWGYPYELVPLLPRAIAFDLGLLPVAYMMVCKYFTSTKSFAWALLIVSFVFAFIGEPIVVALGMYEPYSWKFYYSFPIYFLIGCLGRFISRYFIAGSVQRS
ncbi:hypothetical protein CBW65_14800 [Tumebacillus avium]|uniref:Uncharacterized protein n=1 Tax=Tumebacillus avium TaxID=1903704 RepID=A0A1Y0IRZ5_9BACL|nr:CBO0543 family protein [Tumebacillus avium]ARU62124.1 hypothetical protein CBW65_14800 [Tumebacillus avium]